MTTSDFDTDQTAIRPLPVEPPVEPPVESGLPSPSGRRKRRRGPVSPFTVIGILLLVAGVGCLGWVGYQYFGTNIVSDRAFKTERDQVRQTWNTENAKAPASSKANGKATKAPAALGGSVIALLRIPAFGADYEIPILEGTDPTTLGRGVGHYVGTGNAGEIGNFAIAGHRITHGQPFSQLLTLDPGDPIVVETRTAIYTYILDSSARDLTVQDTANWVLDRVPGQPEVKPTEAMITLTTCQDLFHSPDRSVAFGHLDTTQNKPG